MSAHSLFAKWEPLIRQYAKRPNTEIEFRFGRPSGKGFDTNVGPAVFDKVSRALRKYDGWESTKHTNATVYYFEGEGTSGSRADRRSYKRLTVDEETDEQVGHIKKRVLVDDFNMESAPFNVRLGVSTEEPFEYDGDETSTKQTTKERWSFVRKNLSIDMTIVKGTPDDKDSDEDTTHQIEMEIIDPSQISDDDNLFNLLQKIFDLMKCV
jgi:hypothetical protein